MAGNGDGSVLDEAPLSMTPRALSEIKLNTILAGDGATSSDDEGGPRQLPPDEARGLVGVSIGREQTRLKSPTTPAVDKAAALAEAGGYFGDSFDGSTDDIVEEPEDGEDEARAQQFAVTAGKEEDPDRTPTLGTSPSSTSQLSTPLGSTPQGTTPRGSTPQTRTPQGRSPERTETKSHARLPSPWRAGPKVFERSDHRRSILRDGLFSRRRASSGPGTTLEGLQQMFVNSLPSMPKNFSLTSPFGSSNEAERQRDSESSGTRSKRSSSLFPSSPRFFGTDSGSFSSTSAKTRSRAQSTVREAEDAKVGVVPELPSRPTLELIPSRPSQLRRPASDSSLITQRTLSRVSSLGDDSRFENVNEQVNSRLKAIKDSWQDSNIRLPSMPSVSSFRPDFLSAKPTSVANRSINSRSPGRPVPATHPGHHQSRPVDPMTRQPYQHAREAVADVAPDRSSHPQFKRAVSQLEGDIVILGGYRGSILRSAEPPHRQLWVPIKVGLNIRKVDLEVGINPEDDERATETVIPGGMLTHIGPVDISRRLFKRLRDSENARNGKLRVHDYGYDWRLDPAHLSKQLRSFLEGLQCNQPGVPKEKRGAIVIAHSLGGLITRHAVNQQPDLFRGVVYAGVPTTCVNILGPLRNGDDVLLSSKVLTAQVNFTIRTSFALLPLDGRCFFDRETKEEYPVDFFDVNNWIDYRWSPCVARPLPPLRSQPRQSSIFGSVSSMASAIAIPGRTRSQSRGKNQPSDHLKATTIAGAAEPDMLAAPASSSEQALASGNIDRSPRRNAAPEHDNDTTPATAVTIPREDAIAYLERTLASVKKFKQDLAFHPPHAAANAYPPLALIYGKSTPTVYGARVDGRDGIRHADAYDELAFASGDGVVLARAAMLPERYPVARGGVVSSERGHVTLLGDLEAVGKCLNAILRARGKGVGLGVGE